MSVGRGNRKTRKIHAAGADYRTACDLYAKRRYVRPHAGWRAIGPFTVEKVNCIECLKMLVDNCDFAEFLARSGEAKTGSHGLPVKKCKRCGEWDEFTSESDAHGMCCSCMNICNRPSH